MKDSPSDSWLHQPLLHCSLLSQGDTGHYGRGSDTTEETKRPGPGGRRSGTEQGELEENCGCQEHEGKDRTSTEKPNALQHGADSFGNKR
uniref:Uncharacterized protein n=1 Tax=Knipowitschia caucasica TaxID=637954 RepID=A0AAV2JPN4_KNICA